jgi:hypothetical protein
MNRLPFEIVQKIGFLLDYNSRVYFNQCLKHKDQCIKRLNSDSHNLQVKIELITLWIKNSDEISHFSISKQCRIFLKIFQYLSQTRDKILFEINYPKWRDILYYKTDEFSNNETYRGKYVSRYNIRAIKRACYKIREKLDAIPGTKSIRPQCITIK